MPVEASARNIFERTGMCVEFPSGKANNGVKNLPSAYLFDSLNEKPLPIGYFPFTFKDAASWPFPSFEGSLNGAEFVDDDVFGSALHCKQVHEYFCSLFCSKFFFHGELLGFCLSLLIANLMALECGGASNHTLHRKR